jgi:hypothetical protein
MHVLIAPSPLGWPARCVRSITRVGLLTCVGLLGLALASSSQAEDVPLEGSWFVVAHFTDESTANPEATRWVDEVWIFEKKGSRLQWTKYPLVVFDNTQGRFESRGRNPRSRVLAGWEPNEAQLAQIEKGPRVNSRGSKTKTLKQAKENGWKSSSRTQMRSLSVVGYQQNWEIQYVDGMPLFSREDTMGNAGTGTAEGGVTFQVTALGARPSGVYQRDGTQRGTFFMLRTPPPRGLEKKEGSVNERSNKRRMERELERWNAEQVEGKTPE